ncbi:ABC transporter substrate-binding protein [Cryobacterium sp. SO2]|uniref:ABC transporter substrate-binding protein n=1 Tax=Cryobacterium sp. SO2 TaxID=1897060 RepID=UPI00223D9CD3|nr:ABC transporter substrate-binding protein [Cryobacterium sp. SO2]WEO76367.1 ABC transporter substrate-binding protein [Cryobacterium sp. SO2]
MSPTLFSRPARSAFSRPQKAALLTGLAAVTALTLAGCSSASSTDSFGSAGADSLTVVSLQAYSTPPDPDVNYDGPGLNIIENTYEGLVAYKDGEATAEIVPELATDWTLSDDSLTYTFTLREGVTFHDGTEFNADAVVASFERRTDVDGGPAYMVGDVTAVTPVDDYTVEVTLAAPNSAFVDYLASPFGLKIISPTVLADEAGDDFAQTYLTTHDAGTGPYELSAVDTGVSYELTAADDYWGDAPEFTTVNIEISDNASATQLRLERGEIDGVLGNLNKSTYASFVDNDEIEATAFPNYTTQMIYMNPASSIFTTADDRAALFAGIDTDTIIDSAMGDLEVPTSQLFPAGMVDSALDDQGVTYDPAALQSIVDSGIATGKTIRIGYPASSADAAVVAQELGATLSSAGLPSEAVSMGSGSVYMMTDDLAAAPDLVIMGAFPDAAHVDAFARIIYTPNGGLDLFAAEVPGLSDDLDAALLTDGDAAYGDIAAKIIDTKYWFSIGSLQTTTITRTGLTGIDDARNLLEYNVLHFAALGNE